MEEVNTWRKSYFPLDRLRGYLQSRGLWDLEKEEALVSLTDQTIRNAMKR